MWARWPGSTASSLVALFLGITDRRAPAAFPVRDEGSQEVDHDPVRPSDRRVAYSLYGEQ
jgi:hypothetical protein